LKIPSAFLNILSLRIAAGWGAAPGAQYIGFVFANEPVHRLEPLGARVRKALVDGTTVA
jgi:hypothetical protein